MMFRVLRDTKWYNPWSKLEDMGTTRPQHTSWLPSSIQPSDNECGYYVILNAWSVALGLETNPDVCLDWSDNFFRDLQDIIHLARIGRASWMLIYAFLRCHDYAREGEVSLDRQFQNISELRNEAALISFVDEKSSIEQVHLSEHDMDSQELATTNILRLPVGARLHNDSAVFPSDRWDEDTRDLAIELGRRGKLDLNYTERQAREAVEEGRKDRGQEFMRQLQTSGLGYSRSNRTGLLKSCRDYLSGWHSHHNNILQEAPCEIARDTIRFYDVIFDKENFGETLRGDTFRV